MRKRFLVLLAVTALVLRCNYSLKQEPEHLKPEDIIGVWQGSYFGGNETFTFKGDGTLVQEFTRDGKSLYKSSSHWMIFTGQGDGMDGVEVSEGVYWSCEGKYPQVSATFEKYQPLTIHYMNRGYFDDKKILMIREDDLSNGYFLSKEGQPTL
ncbi:hypothetical protein [Armatimonas rosea]|uniref:Uncharacterized protein n=1 Tax=Armatimonas rosea TaxID=685828 RepID=A0A7W9SSY8_ARMRO|nr:hypothetical protein [Armatimonas rosea]MBB6052131.1 hypothetical protein [Armatimonas rosea]